MLPDFARVFSDETNTARACIECRHNHLLQHGAAANHDGTPVSSPADSPLEYI
ncbi:DUF7563 family protein [Natrialba sp. SSL1]|uniref:DUF7563 family protein n=1 Tax=Natrialba sp. SSL1 TaxID=1869245 RepID=UPI003B96955F